MPFRFVCSRCGATLYESEDDILAYMSKRNSKNSTLEPPITQFIKHKIGLECPKCGHKLSLKPVKIEVSASKGGLKIHG